MMGTSAVVTAVFCNLPSSCAITAAYNLSISSCLLTLSASITFWSKLTTLSIAGDMVSLTPLRILAVALFLLFPLRGEYQLRPLLLKGLIGEGSKFLPIGFTISVGLVAISRACRRSLRPMVRRRVPRMKMVAT